MDCQFLNFPCNDCCIYANHFLLTKFNYQLEKENFKYKLIIVTNCAMLLCLMCNAKIKKQKKKTIKNKFITLCQDNISVYF